MCIMFFFLLANSSVILCGFSRYQYRYITLLLLPLQLPSLPPPKCSPPPIFWSGHLYLLVPSLLLPIPAILAMVLFYFPGFCSHYRLCPLDWRFPVTTLFFETLAWNSSTNPGCLACLHFQALVLQAVKLLFLKWFLEIELEIFCQNPFHINVWL